MEPEILVERATTPRWRDVETIFGTRGDPARCWCQWFFDGGHAGPQSADGNREALRTQVESESPPGVVAYRDGEPVGWCAVAPRPGYGRLRRSEVLRGTRPGEFDDPRIWSVTCFVVRVGFRRQGIAAALLEGAVALARAGGAAVVEGYPVDVLVRTTASSAELFHGPLSTFLAAGFREVRRPRPARPVVRLEITGD